MQQVQYDLAHRPRRQDEAEAAGTGVGFLYGYAGDSGSHFSHRRNRCCGCELLPHEAEGKPTGSATSLRFTRELVQSLSGIVGTDSTPEDNKRFAAACNTLST